MPDYSRIEWLDGWRCVAVLLVILSHAIEFVGQPGYSAPGKLGVYIFFAISGYIVTKTLVREKQQTGAIDAAHFYKRRFLRIVPPLFAYILACLVLFSQRPQIEIAALRSATFTCNLAIPIGSCEKVFGHTWSLAFEEQFYLILPFVLVPPRRWTNWLLFGIALLLASTPMIWPIHFVGRIGFVQIYLLLGLGAAYARYQERVDPFLARIPLFCSIAALVLAGIWMELPPSEIQMFAGPLVALAVMVGVFSLPVRSRLAFKLLSSRPARTIGLYSYTLYLWQQLAFLKTDWNTGFTPLILLGGAFVLAAISYHTLEAVCRRLAHRSSA